MKILIYLLFFSFSILLSCSHFDRLIYPSNYIKIKESTNDNYDFDESDVLTIDNERVFKAEAGRSPERRISLKSIDDEAIVRIGQPFVIDMAGLDLSDVMITTESSSISNSIKIKVRKKYDQIQFKNKCETIEVYNVDFLPILNVEDDLKHQIIVTPIFSKNSKLDCNLLGYQIRYGDKDYAKCIKEAGEIYDKFKECVYGKSKIVNPPPKDVLKILFKRRK